jgi:hypothetical protein
LVKSKYGELAEKPPETAAAKISASLLKLLKLKANELPVLNPVAVLLHQRMPLSLLLVPPESRDETQSELHAVAVAGRVRRIASERS